jgi:hypothetical protein
VTWCPSSRRDKADAAPITPAPIMTILLLIKST